MKKFWMVLGSKGMPVVRHLTEGSARSEAARLARQAPGESFTVLGSESTVRMDDLRWQNHEEEEEVPF